MYPVNNIYPCIQGEGCNTGLPMLLVRLQGCPVGCPFCDTKETWTLMEHATRPYPHALGVDAKYSWLNAEDLVGIKQEYPELQWVLLTGGEPAEYDLKPLVAALHDINVAVALETSGTAVGHVDAEVDWVCVSPKVGMPGGRVIDPRAVADADEITWVVGKQADLDAFDAFLTEYNIPPHCVRALQPMSRSPKGTKLCIDTALKRGWRLSAQVHKYLELP